MKTENLKTEDNSKALTTVGIFAALAASLCCITPVLALLAGVSGVASSFSWMDPARPYLIGLAVAALSYAWYRSLFPADGAECGPDGICKVENKSFLASRTFLIIITILAIGLMAFPYYSKIFYPQADKQTIVVSSDNVQQVAYKVSGMTCPSCEETIQHSVNQLPGIMGTKVDYSLGTASIKYDPSKTGKKAIIKAINATGYKAEGELKP